MPQADLKTKEICGQQFQVAMLPPRKAQRILVEMTKVVGPGFASVLGEASKSKGKIMDADIDFQAVATQLFMGLTPEILESHQQQFAEKTLVDGRPLTGLFDAVFLGKLVKMYTWHAFAIEVNFSDFGEAFRSVSNLLQSLGVQEESKSPSVSTGASEG